MSIIRILLHYFTPPPPPQKNTINLVLQIYEETIWFQISSIPILEFFGSKLSSVYEKNESPYLDTKKSNNSILIAAQ